MTSWDVARLTARLGDHNIRTHAETQHVERKIKRVVRHRGFDMRTLVSSIYKYRYTLRCRPKPIEFNTMIILIPRKVTVLF